MPPCPECETEVAADAAFCRHCGATLPAGEGEKRPAAGPAPSDAGGGRRTGGSEARRPKASPRQRPTDAPESGGVLQGRFWTNALLGGVGAFLMGVFVALLFAPFYPLGILAGAFFAGLLCDAGRNAGAKVGAVAGVVATLPFLLFVGAVVLLGVGLLTGGGGPPGMGPDAITGMGIIAAVAFVFAVGVNAVFGALGGWLGGVAAEDGA